MSREPCGFEGRDPPHIGASIYLRKPIYAKTKKSGNNVLLHKGTHGYFLGNNVVDFDVIFATHQYGDLFVNFDWIISHEYLEWDPASRLPPEWRSKEDANAVKNWVGYRTIVSTANHY